MDFTIKIYKDLLNILKSKSYKFQTYNEFLTNPSDKSIVLRHDVDLLPLNSLKFAQIQHAFGIKGTYYFRAVPESWNVDVIKEIDSLGHEIGYHYENLTTCRGNMDKAIADFEYNLRELRKLAQVNTICMHGSPASKYDSKDLWKFYNYRDYDVIGEPYFDTDFEKVYYLTDTGRCWDGHKFSVRDKVESSYDLTFHTTQQIIDSSKENGLPNQIMFTFHPQRWNDKYGMWVKELIMQNTKNIIKSLFFVR